MIPGIIGKFYGTNLFTNIYLHVLHRKMEMEAASSASTFYDYNGLSSDDENEGIDGSSTISVDSEE